MEERRNINTANLVAKTSQRLLSVSEDEEARIAEALLNETPETEAEIAELEAITNDDENDTESPKADFVVNDGPMKNIHMKNIQADEEKENK